MREKELWLYFVERQVYSSRPLERTLVWVHRDDFTPVEHHFKKDFNIFHRGRSYRSKGFLMHIHCIDQGEYILAHRDMGNLSRFLPFAVLHFVFDVAPYMALAWIKRVSFQSFFTLPHR
ncbi:MAG TPA: hypothetical protein VG984_02280 [Candidatus Paceibacterota bacterium]|nr:hypothetical protein [Candidatus Paceibacterota bacterium]